MLGDEKCSEQVRVEVLDLVDEEAEGLALLMEGGAQILDELRQVDLDVA